jgi:hypothetical protein
LHLFIPPIGKFNAGGIDDAMALVGMKNPIYIVGDGDRVIAVKGAALAVGWTIKVKEFGEGTARISC